MLQVLYSTNKLLPRQLSMLENQLDGLEFVCGTTVDEFIDDYNVSHIFNKVLYYMMITS